MLYSSIVYHKNFALVVEWITMPPSEGGGAGSIPAESTKWHNQKGGEAAPLETATDSASSLQEEHGEKHRLKPYFNFGGRKFFNLILKPRKSLE